MQFLYFFFPFSSRSQLCKLAAYYPKKHKEHMLWLAGIHEYSIKKLLELILRISFNVLLE